MKRVIKGETVHQTFELEIQLVDNTCLFKLSGIGLKLSTKVPYPDALDRLYQSWQRAYLNFYRQSVRGKKQLSETVSLSEKDWRLKLVQAEINFLSEFHQWLRREELYTIRSAITEATKAIVIPGKTRPVDIFLTCHSDNLEALPWESWEVEGATRQSIRLIRSPVEIRHEPVRCRAGKPRILVFVGDDTGLELTKDLEVSQKQLKGLATLKVMGWGITSQTVSELKQQLLEALVDDQGWDAILFFGHSDTGALTGGELAIAPNSWIGIDEIQPQLLEAKKRGLRFALFNSCNGAKIASTLINLGLSQVVVMREPIHNLVAQQFLVDFLQGLAQYQDVHEATVTASQGLKLNHMAFPSASLIPSLYCHSEAELFRILPRGWKEVVKKVSPTRVETIALGSLLVLTIFHIHIPVLNGLLNARLGVQAIVRQIMSPSQVTKQPPVQLVMVDQKSLTLAGIPESERHTLDRGYLAALLQKISPTSGSIIGIDFLWDSPSIVPEDDEKLLDSMKTLVNQDNWLVLATSTQSNDKTNELFFGLDNDSKNWSLSASIDFWPNYRVDIPSFSSKCDSQSSNLEQLEDQVNFRNDGDISSNLCTFAHLIGVTHSFKKTDLGSKIKLNSKNQSDLSGQLLSALKQDNSSDIKYFKDLRSFLPLTPLPFRPIVDFSLPPREVYRPIMAWEILESSSEVPVIEEDSIILIVPGGYEAAEDRFSLPLAMSLWRWIHDKPKLDQLIGGEVHAYTIHHWLNRHWVIPVFDIVMVVFVMIIGKSLNLILANSLSSKKWVTPIVIGGVVIYGGFALLIYVSGNILLPWLLPSIAVSGYGWSMARSNRAKSIK